MSSKAKSPVTLAALLLVAGLAGCTTTPAPQTSAPSQEPSASSAATESDADACSHPARISVGGMRASLTGNLLDLGARDMAAGTVGLDDEGNIVSYTVAAGDAPYAIGERLCIENATSLAELNHTREIHPDQVLRLNPNPVIPWIPYYNPDDAPAGFQQIPYQYAIEAMAAAAEDGDVDTMRAVWTNELSGMFTNPKHIEMIQKVLDIGDLYVLNQMFS